VFFFQAEDGIRDFHVTGVQTCALPIWGTNVLHVAHRAITQGFFVGDASGAEPCDFVLPPDVLGTPRLPLVLGSGAGPDGVEAPEIGRASCRERERRCEYDRTIQKLERE